MVLNLFLIFQNMQNQPLFSLISGGQPDFVNSDHKDKRQSQSQILFNVHQFMKRNQEIGLQVRPFALTTEKINVFRDLFSFSAYLSWLLCKTLRDFFCLHYGSKDNKSHRMSLAMRFQCLVNRKGFEIIPALHEFYNNMF